jgi:hypothetical protein
LVKLDCSATLRKVEREAVSTARITACRDERHGVRSPGPGVCSLR